MQRRLKVLAHHHLTSGSTSFAKRVISSGDNCAKRDSTSISAYSLKSFPYSFAGVVIVVVVVVEEVCNNKMIHLLICLNRKKTTFKD